MAWHRLGMPSIPMKSATDAKPRYKQNGLLKVWRKSTLPDQTSNMTPNWVCSLMAMPGNERVWAYTSNAHAACQVRRRGAKRGIFLSAQKPGHPSLLYAAMQCYSIRLKVNLMCKAWLIFVLLFSTTQAAAILCVAKCFVAYPPMACDLRSDETLLHLGGLTIWPSLAWNTRNICGGIFRIQITVCSDHSLFRVGRLFCQHIYYSNITNIRICISNPKNLNIPCM